MAKKRKASGKAQTSGPKEVDAADARLGPITSYKDVADSEDEFHLNRDTLMLDDGPGSKRRRKDDDIELSDEEILAYDESDSDDEEETPVKSKKAKRGTNDASSDEEAEGEEGEGDQGWWGSSKKEYYDADNIETEADALEEEAEAKRLQDKKLSKMVEEDFVFDGDEWLAEGEPQDGEEDELVTEVLKDIEITDDMGPDERYRMLKTRYPEFEHLVSELEKQQPILETLKSQANGKPAKSLEAVRYWVLGCYVATLASYFAILTSPARDASKTQKTLDSFELRDHEIMQTLLECREAWRKLKDLKSLNTSPEEYDAMLEEAQEVQDKEEKKKLKNKKSKKNEQAAAEKKAKRKAEAQAVEATVADLYNLPLTITKKTGSAKITDADSDSDFGEETALDARTAEEKAARKKSLKFYTAQIAQKANKRASAGRDAGGDADLPYRERLKDRQARLMREAERRGTKASKRGADLGDESDEEDKAEVAAMRNDEDEYYDMVAHKSKVAKDEKAARYAAYAAAGKADRVAPIEEVGEDGKRKISYMIEKNKGLAPKRKKEVRNPRVKKRMQYEAKQKKLSSMKPIWKGGEPKGGYKGELSGINTGVIKSVKL